MIKTFITLGVIVLILGLFFTWYQFTFSMDYVHPYELNDPKNEHQLLIATQGSDFKDEITQKIVANYSDRQFYIKVIDVSKLANYKIPDWEIVIIMHTWEIGVPEENVALFLGKVEDISNVIVVTTSGDGGFTPEGIDGISCASVMEETETIYEEIMIQAHQITP